MNGRLVCSNRLYLTFNAMEHRNRYLTLYFASVIFSILAGFLFHNIGISLLLLLVTRLAVNIWYAQKLKLSIFIQLFVGIFSSIGLFYLLGVHPTLSPVSKLLMDLVGFYEKNFKKIFTASLALVATTIGIIFIAYIPLVVIKTIGYEQATTNLGLFVLNIGVILISGAVLLIGFLWFYASLMHVLEPLIANEPNLTLTNAMHLGLKKIPALIGASAIKALYAFGPLAVVLVAFLIYVSSAILSGGLLSHLRTGIFSSYSPLNLLYYIVVIGLYAYTWYIIIRLTFSNFGILFSNASVLDSIHESFALTKGAWWAIAWRIFASGFVIGAVILVTVGSFAYLTSFGGVIAFLGYLGQIFLYMFFFPLLFSIPLYLYYELKHSKITT